MPTSPAQTLHLYWKEMEGHQWEDCLSPASVANGVVFDACYCYCKTRIVWGLLCQLVSLWVLKSEMSHAESGCVNAAVVQLPEIDSTESERDT